MKNVIKSVEKGWGEASIFFSTNKQCAEQYVVDEIKEESKQVSSDKIINIYRGYKDGNIKFEMGLDIDITVTYAELEKPIQNGQ